MKKIYNIAMLLGALAFTTSACTNSDNEPNYGEITLTTPVVTLDGVTATVSRTEPVLNYNQMDLHVELLNTAGATTGRNCTYKYDNSDWSVAVGNTALVVTGGVGSDTGAADYHARAWAKVNLAHIPAIIGAIYETPESAKMSVYTNGKFQFSGQNMLSAKTAGIQVKVLNPNGEELSAENYTLDNKFERISTASWNSSVSGESNAESNGNFVPVVITQDTEIFSITWNNATYKVSTNALTLEAGKFYVFTIKLGGNSTITIGGDNGGITLSPFDNTQNHNIPVGRT